MESNQDSVSVSVHGHAKDLTRITTEVGVKPQSTAERRKLKIEDEREGDEMAEKDWEQEIKTEREEERWDDRERVRKQETERGFSTLNEIAYIHALKEAGK